jgi:peptidoglycan hydrolase FlgJ
MDITALQPHVKASSIPFDQLAANPNVSEQDKVKEACRQFEAILLRQILGEARKSSIATSTEGTSTEKDIYNEMIDNQVADSISRSGSFGLAKSLEKQLVRQVLPKAESSAQATSAPSAEVKTVK